MPLAASDINLCSQFTSQKNGIKQEKQKTHHPYNNKKHKNDNNTLYSQSALTISTTQLSNNLQNSSTISLNLTLPIQRSTHPCDIAISNHDIILIQQTFSLSLDLPDNITSLSANSHSNSISYQSFAELLSHDSPINDTIILSFLSLVRTQNGQIKVKDTQFSYFIKQYGWDMAFKNFFLHHNSSTYAKCIAQKPTLSTPTIIFPFHIHGTHWVTVVQRIINHEILFFYSDDMNNKNTEETV